MNLENRDAPLAVRTAAPVETPPADLLPVETAPAPEKDPAPGVPVARRRRYKSTAAPLEKAPDKEGTRNRRRPGPGKKENPAPVAPHEMPVDDLKERAAAAARKDVAARESWTSARAAWLDPCRPAPAPHEKHAPETAPNGPETAPAAPVEELPAPAPEKPCKARKRPGKGKPAPAPETAPAAPDKQEQIAFC